MLPAPASLHLTCIHAGNPQVRVGYGLFVVDIIVGICDVVCPVMIVILFVLCRTIVVKYVVIKNIEKIVMKCGAVCICVTRVYQSDETLTRKLELHLGTTYKWR